MGLDAKEANKDLHILEEATGWLEGFQVDLLCLNAVVFFVRPNVFHSSRFDL